MRGVKRKTESQPHRQGVDGEAVPVTAVEGEQESTREVPAARLTRRRFLAAAAGLAAAGVASFEAATRLGSGSAGAGERRFAGPFRSRPDLAAPAVAVLVPARGVAPGYVVLASGVKGSQQGPLIVDNRGEPVWFQPLTGVSAANADVQQYAGQPVLTWWEGKVTSGHGLGEYVLADSTYREIRRVRAGNGLQGDLHEFLVTPQGTALLTAYQSVTSDLRAVGGPPQGQLLDSIVQEVDIASGRVLFEWRARDHVGLDESYAHYSGGAFDHFHVNSIDVDPDGNLLVSARHTWTIYKVDRRTGRILWRLGGKRSSFQLGPGVRFAWQHDARRQPDGSITVFDDGDGPTKVESESRGLRLRVDEKAGTARLAHAYSHQDYLAEAMGSMQQLADGGAFIGWGTVPGFSEFTSSGALRFDARPAGISYRAHRRAWAGQPTTQPDLVVESDAAGRSTAFVSWNGATTVARWRVNGGSTSAGVRPVGVAARRGFETALPIAAGTRYVSVDALDGNGRTLARSGTLRLPL
jgi:Arylsulfotransferase (ASST)